MAQPQPQAPVQGVSPRQRNEQQARQGGRIVGLRQYQRSRHPGPLFQQRRTSRSVDDRKVRVQLTHPASKSGPIHPARQIDVGEQNVDGATGNLPKRLHRVARFFDRKALLG